MFKDKSSKLTKLRNDVAEFEKTMDESEESHAELLHKRKLAHREWVENELEKGTQR